MTKVGSGVNFAFPCVDLDTHIISNQVPDLYNVTHYSMTQMPMKAVMKIFGTRRVDEFSKELKICTSGTHSNN